MLSDVVARFFMKKSLKELEEEGKITIEFKQPFCKKCGSDYNYNRSIDKKTALCECGISSKDAEKQNLVEERSCRGGI